MGVSGKCLKRFNGDRECMSCWWMKECTGQETGPRAEREPVLVESDPSGKAAHEPGAKLDNGKVQADLLEDFGLALLEVAKVGTFGAQKYSRGGWQQVDQGVVRYNAAKWRHALKGRYETHDKDSGLMHAAHEAWNALAKLELMLREKGLTC